MSGVSSRRSAVELLYALIQRGLLIVRAEQVTKLMRLICEKKDGRTVTEINETVT